MILTLSGALKWVYTVKHIVMVHDIDPISNQDKAIWVAKVSTASRLREFSISTPQLKYIPSISA